MLHSFMIISGRGGIVLYRKILTKSLNQPRLIAGLVTALCEFSIGSINMPVATIELDKFTISVVEIPVDDLEAGREYLRIVLFHDNHDGDFYGHVLGLQLLTVFKEAYGQRLLTMQLANVQGVEDVFKGFSSRVRPAIIGSIRHLMQSLESQSGLKQAFLLQHVKDGAFSKSLDRMWYPSSGTVGASLLADLQALLSAGDDVLASQRDESCVVTIGKYVRIERLEVATLVVVAQRPASYITCQSAISYSTRVLKQLFVLMRGLEGSRGLT